MCIWTYYSLFNSVQNIVSRRWKKVCAAWAVLKSFFFPPIIKGVKVQVSQFFKSVLKQHPEAHWSGFTIIIPHSYRSVKGFYRLQIQCKWWRTKATVLILYKNMRLIFSKVTAFLYMILPSNLRFPLTETVPWYLISLYLMEVNSCFSSVKEEPSNLMWEGHE